MRVYLNSPREDTDEFKPFIFKCVVNWHRLKDRTHDVQLLKALSAAFVRGANIMDVYESVVSDIQGGL